MTEQKYSVIDDVVGRMEGSNKLIMVLSLIGCVVIAIAGLATQNWILVPIAGAYFLTSTLIFRVIDAFGVHIKESHKPKYGEL